MLGMGVGVGVSVGIGESVGKSVNECIGVALLVGRVEIAGDAGTGLSVDCAQLETSIMTNIKPRHRTIFWVFICFSKTIPSPIRR
jgi:hypothetical protein